ncbi:Ntn hydrolase family protein [Methylacidiphilum caldifontis]|uniref:Proteasome subunit alpha n=1 Tax=Methylacidiphilum caldifontis TaxID=2795386 RepID=A0A4Y8P6T9_9BACT|nr:proteasome subunit alpha [Methylacidiphilum caldifontis]QSR88818.1 proteasome subunit alpha [Methylacidiphilum caldifontis]TFE65889.1 proteasome subunit alpha [Methylacidiphilum caldifontis]
MIEEPYRWLEAISNRREYIEDQLGGAAPVVLVNGEPGIVIATKKAGTPKIYEIYDHLAMGCLGHPADMEKIRQSAIEVAHLEGFTRSRQDVSARRIVAYSLAVALKNAFEQIFSAPFLFRCLFIELGERIEKDEGWTVDYDGSYITTSGRELSRGLLISGKKEVMEKFIKEREALKLQEFKTLKEMVEYAIKLILWASELLTSHESLDAVINRSFKEILSGSAQSDFEVVFLDRTLYEQQSFTALGPEMWS